MAVKLQPRSSPTGGGGWRSQTEGFYPRAPTPQSAALTAPLKGSGRFAFAFLPLLLSACTAVELPAGTATLDPIAFFTGVTNGEGSLDTLVARSVSISVSSLGFAEHGGLKLIQRIEEGEKPERVRTWTMRRTAPGRYTGTLTDAQGPVSISVDGPRAEVRYRTPGGLRIRQQLALQPDGRTILNRLEASKFGLRLAVLEETIRKPLAK